MSTLVAGTVDTDVHCFPDSIQSLYPYLDEYWHWYIWNGGINLGSYYPPNRGLSARKEARETGAFPPRTVQALQDQLLDPTSTKVAILTCLTGLYESRNVYFQAALATAINEWMRVEWLDRDERLRASIVVPSLNPDAAAQEIERLSGDARFVQVLLPVRSETPWGNIRWRLIHEAAERHNLPIALHAWGGYGLSATVTGHAPNYFEDYLYNSQLIASYQVMSLITEGVFDRFPKLRICLAELGNGWIPSIGWRFNKDWNAAWRETPWVRDKPSEYIKHFFKATTSPLHQPSSVPLHQIAEFAEIIGAKDFFMYSSDYPHDHGDDGIERLLEVLDDAGRAAVLGGNAEGFYNLVPVPTPVA